MSQLGMKNIGYHFGIEHIRDSHEILMGRMPNERGAHTKGHNGNTIGICFIGNFDEAPPSEQHWNLGITLVRSLCSIFDISTKAVRGHHEFADYKTCPGKLFDIERFRYELDHLTT